MRETISAPCWAGGRSRLVLLVLLAGFLFVSPCCWRAPLRPLAESAMLMFGRQSAWRGGNSRDPRR
jgi:hypothetical protein